MLKEWVNYQRPKEKKPPRPSFWHFFQLGKSLPDRLIGMARHYGPIVRFPTPMRVFLISHPSVVHTILVTRQQDFTKDLYPYRQLGKILGHGLLTNVDESWRERRLNLQQGFKLNLLPTSARITEECTKILLNRWRKSEQTGRYLYLEDEMLQLMMDITCRSLFSETVSVPQLKKRIRWISSAHRLLMTGRIPWVPTPGNIRFWYAVSRIRREAERFLQKRRQLAQQPEDFLTVLLSLKDKAGNALDNKEIVDEIITFWATGHETTGAALAWFWFSLNQNDSAKQRLREECEAVFLNHSSLTPEILNEMPYLKASLEEGLRLYPVVWNFFRKTLQDENIVGYRIPKGSTLVLCPLSIQRDERYWPEAEQFKPERFLSGDKPKEHYAYFPFGGGPHVCIGKAFANVQAQIIIAQVMREFDIEFLRKKKTFPYRGLITLRPAQVMRIRVRKVTHEI